MPAVAPPLPMRPGGHYPGDLLPMVPHPVVDAFAASTANAMRGTRYVPTRTGTLVWAVPYRWAWNSGAVAWCIDVYSVEQTKRRLYTSGVQTNKSGQAQFNDMYPRELAPSSLVPLPLMQVPVTAGVPIDLCWTQADSSTSLARFQTVLGSAVLTAPSQAFLPAGHPPIAEAPGACTWSVACVPGASPETLDSGALGIAATAFYWFGRIL